MKTRPIFALFLAALALVIAASPTRAAEEAPTKPAKPALEKGMPAETILKLVGKPAEVSPLASPEGKAETWTYRRVVDTQHLLDAIAVETIPVFVRANATEGNVMGTATRPIYKTKHITTYQVTALLLYDGKLVTARQWQEKTQSLDN